MPRQITSRKDPTFRNTRFAPDAAEDDPGVPGGAPEAPRPDRYIDRLVKYVPADAIAAFLGCEATIRSATPNAQRLGEWIAFGALLLALPLYLRRIARVTKPVQILISTASFAVWVFGIGGPFKSLDWYAQNPSLGALAVVLFTFVVGAIDP